MFYYIKDSPKNLYFQLIPKNGSSSILSSLINYDNTNYGGWTYSNVYGSIPQKVKALNYNKESFFNHVYNSKDTVAIVSLRDPYKRLVSAFLNKILDYPDLRFFKPFFERYGRDAATFNNNKIFYFDAFVDMILEFEKNISMLDRHVEKQSKLITLESDKIDYDIFLNTDNLHSDWNRVLDVFPKMPQLPKKKVNTSETNKFILELAGRNMKKIESIYEDDFSLFYDKIVENRGNL